MSPGTGDTPPRAGRSWFPIVALAAVALVALWAGAVLVGLPKSCGGDAVGGACPKPTPDLTSPVVGVVIGVDATSLDAVRGFTLRTSGGFVFAFVLGQLDDPTAFAPGHLAEHQATSTPIRVWFRDVDGARVVYRLEDAPGAAPAT